MDERVLPASHTGQMSCLERDLTEILEESRLPDPEMIDLIEKAFLEGQIDGETMELAYCWIEAQPPPEAMLRAARTYPQITR